MWKEWKHLIHIIIVQLFKDRLLWIMLRLAAGLKALFFEIDLNNMAYWTMCDIVLRILYSIIHSTNWVPYMCQTLRELLSTWCLATWKLKSSEILYYSKGSIYGLKAMAGICILALLLTGCLNLGQLISFCLGSLM